MNECIYLGMVWYSSIYIAPLNSRGPTEALLVRLAPRKETSFNDKKEARAEGGRRFQQEGPATEKDLDSAIVVLVRGTKSSHLSRERRGRRDKAEVGSWMASRRYLGATPSPPF